MGPAGTKIAGRWPKLKAAIIRPGTILSQTPRNKAPSNMSWESAIGRGQRDHVAREQRELHAGLALRHAIAHRRHAARELGDAAGLAHRLLDELRVALERLMGREHVVVGRHDRDVGLDRGLEVGLVAGAAGGEAVGEVAAGQARALRPALRRLADLLEIGTAARGAARRDAQGDVLDAGMHGILLSQKGRWPPGAAQAASSCQVRPSRSIRAIAADGPQVPAA